MSVVSIEFMLKISFWKRVTVTRSKLAYCMSATTYLVTSMTSISFTYKLKHAYENTPIEHSLSSYLCASVWLASSSSGLD